MSKSPDDSTNAKAWLALVEKHKVAFFIIGLGLFFTLDGSLKISVSDKELSLGPVVSDEIRSILILIAGLVAVLGVYHTFIGTSRRKRDPFNLIALYTMLVGVIFLAGVPPLMTYFESIQVVGIHGVAKGTYYVELTAKACDEHSGQYLALAVRRKSNTTPFVNDSDITISPPVKIVPSDTGYEMEVQFETPDDYFSNHVEGENNFDCMLLSIPESKVRSVDEAKTIDELLALGAARIRLLSQSVTYELPSLGEVKRAINAFSQADQAEVLQELNQHERS